MNNHFFTLCEKSQYTTKPELYQCCLKTCTSKSETPGLCYSMCAQIFPSIKDKCALDSKCWNDYTGAFNHDCIEKKKKSIFECCTKRCELQRLDFNCEEYCNNYKMGIY